MGEGVRRRDVLLSGVGLGLGFVVAIEPASAQDDPDGDEALPCAVCGGTAVTWNYVSIVHDGTQVIEGSPVCEAHGQLREVAG